MSANHMSRRCFVGATTASALSLFLTGYAQAAENKRLFVSTNQYPWFTFYRREGLNFNDLLDRVLDEVAEAGLDGYEPIGASPEQLAQLGEKLAKRGLQLRSFYVNALLHDPKQSDKTIEHVLALADQGKKMGTKIVVVNATPLRWGEKQAKNDEQLIHQAKALDELGAELRKRGLMLAYHNHDVELQNAAREFHHMMLGTDPKNVTFCLDAHWIFRGSGNSQVALFDVVKLYGDRVSELHLRQSKDGIWTEAFGPGDIDYVRLGRELAEKGVRPLLVLEQAVEAQSPRTMNALEAHRKGCQYVRQIFERFFAT